MKLKRVANAAVRNLLADQTNLRIMPSITITVNQWNQKTANQAKS